MYLLISLMYSECTYQCVWFQQAIYAVGPWSGYVLVVFWQNCSVFQVQRLTVHVLNCVLTLELLFFFFWVLVLLHTSRRQFICSVGWIAYVTSTFSSLFNELFFLDYGYHSTGISQPLPVSHPVFFAYIILPVEDASKLTALHFVDQCWYLLVAYSRYFSIAQSDICFSNLFLFYQKIQIKISCGLSLKM